MYCPNHRLMRPGHTCNGYRLPNQFEWQYLGRGGTTTDFYRATGETRARSSVSWSLRWRVSGLLPVHAW
jgi:formylglycine-generating enzyme required for sulfatase activity